MPIIGLLILLLGSGCSNHSASTPTVNAGATSVRPNMTGVPPNVAGLQQLKQNATQQNQSH